MEQVYNFDEFSMPMWIKFLFGGLYLVVFVYAIWKTLVIAPKNKQTVTVSSLFVLYFIVFAIFYCINPDYFSYRDWMKISLIDLAYWNNEQVYAYLIWFCRMLEIDYPFELFRLIIWGGALLIVLITSKMYKSLLMPGLVMLFLFVFYSGTFCYARASLAMAVYFMGVAIIMCGDNFFVKILGIALAGCSYFFHHELIIGIAALPGLIVPFEKKKTIFITLIMLAVMIAAITYINSNLELLETIMGNDDISQKMETYNEREQGLFRVSTFISYFNIYFPFILISVFFYRNKHIPKPIAGMYRITLILLMVTIAFMIVDGMRSTYVYRILYINIIPMSFLIAYCYNQGYFKKRQFVIMLMLACLTNCMRLIQAVN